MADSRWGDKRLSSWDEQESNPSNPAGLTQTIGAARGVAEGDNRWSQSQLGAWALQGGAADGNYADVSTSWFTGQNREDETIGWATPFWNSTIDSYNAAAEAGQLNTQFESKEFGTGVVTWDHKGSDGIKDFRFGDVYEGGEFKGNVYEKFDKQTADMMMGQLMFDGKDLARMFAANDDLATLGTRVQEERDFRTTNIPKALEAQAFEEGVQAREETYGGKEDVQTVGGGVAGGAAIGAGTGAALTAWLGPGAAVGAAVGGGIGAAVGGVGAWLNRDEIQEQAARGREMVELAKREEGDVAGATVMLQQGAALAGTFTSPVSQVVHGLADEKRGDDESGFYAVDEKGKSERGLGWQVLGLGAAVTDGVMQFASPLSRGIYLAQMGGQISGEVGTMAATGGKVFNPREGGYNNIFTDDKGDFDPGSASAGLMKIGIDAVQMTGWGALGRSAAKSRATLAAGQTQVEYGGYRYILDDAGRAVSRERSLGGTLSLLAPSEQVSRITANRAARVRALSERRDVVDADDFYRASRELAGDERRLKAALVNAFGEGYEEFAQGLLEPISQDGAIDPKELITSFFYGAAGGLGMSIGATMGPSNAAERQFQIASSNYFARYNTELSRREFDSWDESVKQMMSTLPREDAAASADALKEYTKTHAATMLASEQDLAYAIDSQRKAVEKELKRATAQTDQYTVFTGRISMGEVSDTGELRGDTLRAEALQASAAKIGWVLHEKRRGLLMLEQSLTRDLAEAQANPEMTEVTAELTERLELVKRQLMVAGPVIDRLLAQIDDIYAADEATSRTLIRRFNRELDRAFSGRAGYQIEGLTSEQSDEAAAMLFSVLYSREPKLHSDSFPIFLPQIDTEATLNRESELYLLNMDVLQGIGGDFDGDKLRAEHQLSLTSERWRQLRAGTLLSRTDGKLDLATHTFDQAYVEALGMGLRAEVGSDLRMAADAALASIEKAITTRYGTMMSAERLDSVLENLRTRVAAGVNPAEDFGTADARSGLLHDLAVAAGPQIDAMGRETLTNEWLRISQIVRSNLQMYQKQFVQMRTPLGPAPVDGEQQEIDPRRGVNFWKDMAVSDAQTLSIFAVGNSLFRKFQKVHFSVYNSSVLSNESTDKSDLYQMAQLYAELGRDVTRTELDQVGVQDTVAGRAQVIIRRLVDSALLDPQLSGTFDPATAMSVLANVQMRDVRFVEGEPQEIPGNISLAQWAMGRALDQERAEHRNTFPRDEALQKKHARLRPLTRPGVEGDTNAHWAFFEVFKEVPFGDMLGINTGALGANVTMEQWVQSFIGLDSDRRRDRSLEVQNVPAYLERKGTKDLPYTMSEMSQRSISSYRSVADVLLAVGRSYLTFDPQRAEKSGVPSDAFTGDLAELNATAEQTFVEIYADLRSALADYRTVLAQTEVLPDNRTLLQQLATENPSFGRRLRELVPPGMANSIFESKDGQLYMSPWLYEMFAIEDPQEALMYFWRSLTMAAWNGTTVTVNEEDGHDTMGRRYELLSSRFLRLMLDLNEVPGRFELDLVFRKMHQSKNLDEFFVWLNSAPGIVPAGEAAMLPFVDDVATFEADSTGGWVSANTSSDQRLALTKLKTATGTLRQQMEQRRERQATDTLRRMSIQEARRLGNKATKEQRAELARFEQVLSTAMQLPRGFGINAMRELTRGAGLGLNAPSHNKGVTTPVYEKIGEAQAVDAFGFTPALERVMEAVTTHSISSLRTSLSDLVNASGTAMDSNGREIELEPLDIDTALAMLADPRTEPLALALLTPTALESSVNGGGLVERPLFESSLGSLLDRTGYKEVFPKPGQDMTLSQAMKYLHLVDSRSKTEGGDFPTIRYVNDLLITRLTALDHTVDEFEIGRMTDQAYIDTAKALQMVAALRVGATGDTNLLEVARDAALQVLQQHYTSRVLKDFTKQNKDRPEESGPLSQELLSAFREDERKAAVARIKDVKSKFKGAERSRRIKVIEAQHQANLDRIDRLAESNRANQLVTMYDVVGSDADQAAAKSRITSYVRSMTNFVNRAGGAESIESAVAKLDYAVRSGEDAETTEALSEAEWQELGRAVMGVQLAEESMMSASHISTLPFPDPPKAGAITDTRTYKYFDRTHGYLVTQLLDENSPLLAGAEWLHRLADQGTDPVTTSQIARTLANTVVNTKMLGPWSSAHVSQIVEAHERIDSAGSPAAIAMAGNGPKRWAAIMAATRARFLTDGLLSKVTTATIGGNLLLKSTDPLIEFQVQPNGSTRPQSMPLAQLSNRFYSGIRINGIQVPLDYDNMGFSQDEESQQAGLRYISLERMKDSLARWAKENAVQLESATVELDFIHPDSMPEGQAHNGYYEGKSSTLLPDGSESLLASMWSATGGEIEAATQDPLNALKTGARSLSPFVKPDSSQLAAARRLWSDPDGGMAAMLRAKTSLILTTSQAPGVRETSVEHYNALYKAMKLQHIVVGLDEKGQRAALTADQVIARQLAGTDLGLTDAKLVVLSPEVLRTLTGDTSGQGATVWTDEDYVLNPSLLPSFDSIDSRALKIFGDGWFADTGRITDTSLTGVAAGRAMIMRGLDSVTEKDKRRERLHYLANIKHEEHSARQQMRGRKEFRAVYDQVARAAIGSVRSERSDFPFGTIGAELIDPRSKSAVEHSARQIEMLAGSRRSGLERAWRVVDDSSGSPIAGELSVESLDQSPEPGNKIVQNDLVLVELQTFRSGPDYERRVERALSQLANSGATVVLGSGDGSSNRRFEASEMLLGLGYRPVGESRQVFQPQEYTQQSQTARSYESTLRESTEITPYYNSIAFMAVDPIGTTENVAIVNEATTKLRNRKLVRNLIPSSLFAKYNIVTDDQMDYGPYQRTLAHLRAVLDPATEEGQAARETLMKMAGEPSKGVAGIIPIEEALDTLAERLRTSSSLAPRVGDTLRVGDIIPLADRSGNVIFYRHGLKAPRPRDLTRLQKEGGLKIAMAKTESDKLATSNTGVISSIETRAGYGRQLTLEVPLQLMGDKIQLEWNGMKYIVTRAPDGSWLPQPVIGANGQQIDLWSDVASASSKEATYGRVNNYRNALAFFGFDFLTDMTEFFFPGQDPQDATNRQTTYELLLDLSHNTDLRITTSQAYDLSRANTSIAAFLAEAGVVSELAGGVDPGWMDRIHAPATATEQIAQAMIIYLMTPHAELRNVLSTSGFFHSKANTDSLKTRLVPGLFSDLLGMHGMDSPVHAELISRFNEQLAVQSDGSGYVLHPDWMVEAFGPGGKRSKRQTLRGYFQFGEMHSSGDNPILNGQAYDPTGDQLVSPHNALAAWGAIGAYTPSEMLKKSKAFTRSFRRGGGLAKVGIDGDNAWDAITWMPQDKKSAVTGWRRETAAETHRRKIAREEIVGLFQELNTEKWSPEQVREYRTIAESILTQMNLYGVQGTMVDSWVRMRLGAPHQIVDGNERGVLRPEHAIEAANKILINVRAHLLPTYDAKIPLIDIGHLTTIRLMNENRADGWAPRLGTAENAPRATTWDQWVETAFGTAWTMTEKRESLFEPEFDPIFQLAIDGLMHGYQRATEKTRALPVTTDVLRLARLMDRDTEEVLVSLSGDQQLLDSDPILYHTQLATLDSIIAGQRIYGNNRDYADPAGADAQATRKIERWRAKVDAPDPTRKNMRGIRNGGQTFLDTTTETSAMWRSMLNLRAANTLLNPVLVMWAPMEAWYRRTIDTFSKGVALEGTGLLSSGAARLTERYQDTSIGKVAELAGFETRFTADELRQFRNLVPALAQRNELKSEIYKELMFQYPSIPGIGKVEKALEKAAKFGARIQDPAWGMRPNDLMRHYTQAVMRAATMPGRNINYSPTRLLTELSRDPLWVMRNDIEAHNLGIAAVANVRSIKANVLSLATRGIVDPMAGSPGYLRNNFGNFLKMMTMFQNFWSGFAINALGLQGAADAIAFMVDGKQRKLGLRLQAAVAGTEQPDFELDDAQFYDMSEVLESLDLMDAFIKGGVTHTALFTAGLLAGGLGLSGDDEEEKRRRRAAELQGAGYIQDPRKLAADFRNRDAIYLDWLPFGLDQYFQVPDGQGGSEAVAGMNWVLRTFISPVIGFERFYNTGDFGELLAGFGDAIGSHPIVNQALWSAAVDTAAELNNQAVLESEQGGPENQAAAAHFFITAVGVLDRALLENAFINTVYQGVDEYDRDPYKMQKMDSDGNPQVDVKGEPYATATTRQVVDEQGNVVEQYVDRGTGDAQFHSLTENRFTLAFLGSLWSGATGGGFTGSTYFRENMPVKTRTVELAPTDNDLVELYLTSAFQGMGGAPLLSESEAADLIKNAYKARGEWYDQLEVEKQAKLLVAKAGSAPLSSLTADNREVPTDAGALAILDGLRKGTLQLTDEALNGVFITLEQRNQIKDQWMKELTAEGLEMGLSQQTAASRMKRIMFGPLDDSEAVGLYDLLFTQDIPISDTLEYNQLNTTYVMGPDGRPMATGFTREGLLGALGFKPLTRAYVSSDTNLGMDSRMNSVDQVAGINTGLRALERRSVGWETLSTEEELRAAAEKLADAIGEMSANQLTPFGTNGSYGSSYGGWRNYGGYGGGGGGGGSYSPSIYFTRMNPLPDNISVYGNSIPFINTSNPILRRADVRRERVWSERGRLKQWQ